MQKQQAVHVQRSFFCVCVVNSFTDIHRTVSLYNLLFQSKEVSRSRGPNLHSSPDVLSCLDGPGFRFSLNKNDHRWTVSFRKTERSVHWEGQYKQQSCSRSFNAESESDWQEKLKTIHHWAWTKWSLAMDLNLELPEGKSAQEPGQVEESLFTALQGVIKSLPDKTVYQRK